MTNLKIMESKQQLLVPLVLNGVVGDVPLGVPVRISNVQEIRSENLTILRNGYKSWDHHCSPSHTKMAASAWPGGGETAAADENKFCSTVQNKSWHRPGGMAERVEYQSTNGVYIHIKYHRLKLFLDGT